MDATLWAILATLFAKVQECDALRTRIAELEAALAQAQGSAAGEHEAAEAQNEGGE